MTLKPILLAGLLLTLSACVNLAEHSAPRSAQVGSDATMMLNELARAAALSAEQRRRELAGLEDERRIDDRLRFKVAALLEREDNEEALERSLKNLNALENIDARAQPLVELMRRSLKARIELKQQAAHAQELQDKLDQIKALEKSLQQRTAPAKTP